LSIYIIINFFLAEKRIRERNYINMYNHYLSKPYYNKIITRAGKLSGPPIFIVGSGIFFFFTLNIGILCLKSYIFSTFCVWLWLTWSVWNSSCFYMDYFSKKYEASL
jgi:hypothetical protein